MGENVLPIQTKFYCELLHRTKFPMSLPVHINFSSESNLAIVPSIVCHPYYKCYFLPKNKMLTTKVTGWGIILIEHAWCYCLFSWNMPGVIVYSRGTAVRNFLYHFPF